MLRPEQLVAHGTRPDGECIQAVVTDVVFQGASVRLVSRTEDGTEIASLVSGASDLPFVRPGSSMWLSWDAGAPYVMNGWPQLAGATTTNVDHVEARL